MSLFYLKTASRPTLTQKLNPMEQQMSQRSIITSFWDLYALICGAGWLAGLLTDWLTDWRLASPILPLYCHYWLLFNIVIINGNRSHHSNKRIINHDKYNDDDDDGKEEKQYYGECRYKIER